MAVLISWAEPSLPLVTSPETCCFTSAVLPEPLNSVASSGFFGAAASMALPTAAINAALSNVPGLAAPILSTWLAPASAVTSLGGPAAAPWASATFVLAEGWAFSLREASLTSSVTLVNRGSSAGATGWGAVGAGGQATARCRNARTAGRRITLMGRLGGRGRAGLWAGLDPRL